MAYAATKPGPYRAKILGDVDWLERAQLQPDGPVPWPGSWSQTYREQALQRGDSVSSRWALLGLHAAYRAGVPVKDEAVELARLYWVKCQKGDGGWGHTPESESSGIMTCAGVSSMLIMGQKGREYLQGELIHNCNGNEPAHGDCVKRRGLDWLEANFPVEKEGVLEIYKNYYLYELGRTASLVGFRSPELNDWYRQSAETVLKQQNKNTGSWRGGGLPRDLVATSFSRCFSSPKEAEGAGPALINKLSHGPQGDWNNDPSDVNNLVRTVSRDWSLPADMASGSTLDQRTLQDLMQAPIVFFSGHNAPQFSLVAMKKLHDYVEQGGFIFATPAALAPPSTLDSRI